MKTVRQAQTWVGVLVLAAAAPVWGQGDVVMKAMRDEMARSMKQLQLENLEKPYFISYRVIESDGASVSATFGALTGSSEYRSRRLGVQVRVGDYKLDNTNFYSPSFGGSSMNQVFNGMAQLTLEDDYKELRRQIWLATDATYKKALEDISKKRAALQNKNRSDEVPDFTKEDPAVTTDEAPPVRVDRAQWEGEVRRLSALFRKMPDVYVSGISLGASNVSVRFLTSEGTSYLRRQPTVTFNAHAATQAPDGGPLDDFVWLYGRSLAEIPPEQELSARVMELGERLARLRAAPTLENYNGPVLFEDDAAAQVLRLSFLPSLVGTHEVLMDLPSGVQMQGQRRGQGENPFINKIGARVLPAFLSVTDNPTVAEYNKMHLAGTCKVDEEGIPTHETRLVEKGALRTLLTSRAPVRGIEHSTGSFHAGQTAPSNVIVTAENGTSEAELKAQLLQMVKQRNKEYGIIVRRMRNVEAPVLAYKAFPDGREELIRGVQFQGLNAQEFKDIAAASKEQHVLTVQYRTLNQLPTFTLSDEGYAAVTMAVPALLFEDLTLHKTRGETPMPPVAKHPYFDK